MSDQIKIIHLGGQDEVGKNLTVVEINDDIFVLDCGLKLPDKTKQGIDYIIPRFDYLLENKDKIRAYIITKGLDIGLGGLPYIIKRAPAPVICTSVTRVYLEGFCEKNHAKVNFDFDLVEPNDVRMIAKRKISFFQTATNMANSFGVSINTDKGNIVLINNFIVDNNCDHGFSANTKMLSDVSGQETLLLMLDSRYANKVGYTNPKHKLEPLVEQIFKESKGRIFVALETPDVYNIEKIIKLTIKQGRKLIPFDDATISIFHRLSSAYNTSISEKDIETRDNVERIPPQDAVILMLGFGARIYNKISLFASGNNEDKRMRLLPGDTFIVGTHNDNASEILFSEAVDELYKVEGINIHYFNHNQFLKMYASEEDIKTMLSIFRPKYYVPVSGDFKNLLANAKIAVNMNIGLNHMNVFVVDNGMQLIIDEKRAYILPNKVITGDLYVDGINIGESNVNLMNDRKTLGDDGVVVIGAIISFAEKRIVFGPDIQTRGLVVVKESEQLIKEIDRLVRLAINDEFNSPNQSLNHLQENIKDLAFKSIRRITLKTPLIIPQISLIK